jgi:hypothetical protein
LRRPWPSAALAALALATGCGAPRHRAAHIPREALPESFQPLRWSVSEAEIPVLFPNRRTERSTGDRDERVVWRVEDVRRVAGVPGALRVAFGARGEVTETRLAFGDPRRQCDPDLGELPRGCDAPAAALVDVFDALAAELSDGRGGPPPRVEHDGARAAAWRGIDIGLRLSLARSGRGAWSVHAVATPAPPDDAPASRR